MRTTIVLVACGALAALGCRDTRRGWHPGPAGSATTRSAEQLPGVTATVTPKGPESSFALDPLFRYSVPKPVAVAYDGTSNRYLVSSAGTIVAFDAKAGATATPFVAQGLDDPRGIASAQGLVYVVDRDKLRSFDAKTGAPKPPVTIEGATSLEDVAVAPDGKVFVVDSALPARGAAKHAQSGIYVVEGGRPRTLVKGDGLGHPTGVAFDGDVLRVVSRGGALYRIDPQGKKHDEVTLPYGDLRGLVVIPPFLYTSSREGRAVFRGLPTGSFASVIPNLGGPGRLAYDAANRRLVVPLLTEDRVDVFATER